jgi:hypothetical protein
VPARDPCRQKQTIKNVGSKKRKKITKITHKNKTVSKISLSREFGKSLRKMYAQRFF